MTFAVGDAGEGVAVGSRLGEKLGVARPPTMKKLLLVPVVCALVAASAVASGVGVALALPGEVPDSTLGTNGQVRALLQVGNVMWVGGQFTATSDGQSGL
jgi:hypothetical protein